MPRIFWRHSLCVNSLCMVVKVMLIAIIAKWLLIPGGNRRVLSLNTLARIFDTNNQTAILALRLAQNI